MQQKSVDKNEHLEQKIFQLAPLVKQIAKHLLLRLPSSIQLDDLIQVGMMGLMEAIKNYDESKGATLETYAGIRIKGMMLDEVRKNDWVPRSVHKNARVIAEKIKSLEHNLGRSATDREISESFGVSILEYHQMLIDATGAQIYALDDFAEGDEQASQDYNISDDSDLSEIVHWNNFKEKLAEAITTLPEREKMILSLYYDDGLNLKEIGSVIGVSESRVCQMHSQAMCRIQAKLIDYKK